MKKKLVGMLLTISMIATAVMGCGSDTTSGTEDKAVANNNTQTIEKEAKDSTECEPITIEFWNSWTGSDGDTLVAKVEEFNKVNPWSITVNMDISSEFSEKLATTLPTGDCAPLILTGCSERFRYSEYLQPLDDIWENTSLKEEDFNKNSLDVCKNNDVLYGVPFQNSLYYMYWNKDLFEKAGLDPETPPKSFAEWEEYAAKITDEETNTYGSGMFMSYGTHQMALLGIEGGWAISKAEDGSWNVNIKDNEAYKEYLTWMKGIYDKGDNPLENEIDSMFKAGQIGMVVNGPWLAAGADEAGINFGMCKIFDTEPRGDVAGFFVTSSATPEEKLASERFIQWWYTGNEGTALEDTGAGVWSLSFGFPTAYIPLAESEGYKTNERLGALALDNNSKDSLWSITDPNFAGWAEAIGVIGTMTESVVYGTPIEEAMEIAQQEAEALVETYGKSAN